MYTTSTSARRWRISLRLWTNYRIRHGLLSGCSTNPAHRSAARFHWLDTFQAGYIPGTRKEDEQLCAGLEGLEEPLPVPARIVLTSIEWPQTQRISWRR